MICYNIWQMTETRQFTPTEGKSFAFITGNYTVDNNLVEMEVNRRFSDTEAEEAGIILMSSIREAWVMALNNVSRLDILPETSKHPHLPNLLIAIRDLETKFGVIKRVLTVEKELEILTVAETSMLARTQEGFNSRLSKLFKTPDSKFSQEVEDKVQLEQNVRDNAHSRIRRMMDLRVQLWQEQHQVSLPA